MFTIHRYMLLPGLTEFHMPVGATVISVGAESQDQLPCIWVQSPKPAFASEPRAFATLEDGDVVDFEVKCFVGTIVRAGDAIHVYEVDPYSRNAVLQRARKATEQFAAAPGQLGPFPAEAPDFASIAAPPMVRGPIGPLTPGPVAAAPAGPGTTLPAPDPAPASGEPAQAGAASPEPTPPTF